METKTPTLPPRQPTQSTTESSEPLPPRPSITAPSPTSSLTKRDRIVLELLATERSYVTSLESLIDCYAKPLTLGTGSNSGTASLLTPAEARGVFANADHLLRLNSSLLQSLERELAKNGPSLACVGKILFEFAPFFRVYMSYIDRYEEQVRTLEDLCVEKKGLTELIEQCRQNPKCRGLALKSHLIMPVQRIPRYKMLLSELADRTEDKHPDAANVLKAKEKIGNVAKQINESIRQQENRQVMLDLRAAIGDGEVAQSLWQAAWPGEDLIERYRHLIRTGRMVKRSRTKKSNKSKCIFVLLNDTLIYGDVVSEISRKSSTTSRPMSVRMAATPIIPKKMSLRACIPLWTKKNKCHVNRRPGDCTIEFLSDVKSFDIVCSTEFEADQWSSDIGEAIAAQSAHLLMLDQRKKWNELRTAIINGIIDEVKDATTRQLITAKMEECDALFELAVKQMLQCFDCSTVHMVNGNGNGNGNGNVNENKVENVSVDVRISIIQLLLESSSIHIKMLDEQFTTLMTIVSEEGDSGRAASALEVASLLLLRVSAKARDKAMMSAAGPGRSTVVTSLLGHTSVEAREDAFLSASGALLLSEDADSLKAAQEAQQTQQTQEETKTTRKKKTRRASLTYHRKAASAFDISSSAESLDVVRELAPLVSETTRLSVLKGAAKEGCMSLCAVLISIVTEESREEALRSMQSRIKSIPNEGPDRKRYEKVITMLGTIEQVGSSRRTRALVGCTIVEKAQQQKAASLTPMARKLLGAWESKEGLLSKRGGMVKTWKTRLFYLHETLLTYHKPLKIAGFLSNALGTIDLSVEGTTIDVPSDLEIKKMKLKLPCFALRTPGRVYYMQSNSDEDRDKWIHSLNMNIAIANSSTDGQ